MIGGHTPSPDRGERDRVPPCCGSHRGSRPEHERVSAWGDPRRAIRNVALTVAAALLLSPLAAHAQHNHGGSPEPRSGGGAQAYVPTERPPEPEIRVVRVDVTERGFEPAHVTVRRGQRVRLVVTRRTEATCAREIILDEYLVWRRLPLNESVSDTFTTDRTGEFPFRCAAGHVTGTFKVEP